MRALLNCCTMTGPLMPMLAWFRVAEIRPAPRPPSDPRPGATAGGPPTARGGHGGRPGPRGNGRTGRRNTGTGRPEGDRTGKDGDRNRETGDRNRETGDRNGGQEAAPGAGQPRNWGPGGRNGSWE